MGPFQETFHSPLVAMLAIPSKEISQQLIARITCESQNPMESSMSNGSLQLGYIESLFGIVGFTAHVRLEDDDPSKQRKRVPGSQHPMDRRTIFLGTQSEQTCWKLSGIIVHDHAGFQGSRQITQK